MVNRHANKSSTKDETLSRDWSSLPVLAFRHLCQFLNLQTKKRLRLVCSAWADNVDLDYGLGVRVNEKVKGNIDFISSVRVTRMNIVNWKCPWNQYLFQPTALTELVLSGPYSPEWLICNALVKCRNLRQLTFHTLTETILFQDSIEDPIFDLHVSTKRIALQHLQSLILQPSQFRGNLQRMQIKKTRLFIESNIWFLLQRLYCPRLQLLQIFHCTPIPSLSLPRNAYVQKYNWRSRPLQEFLRLHSNSLKQLILPEFEIIKWPDEQTDRVSSMVPRNLITISFGLHLRPIEEQKMCVYWKALLTHQTRLKHLMMDIKDIPISMRHFWHDFLRQIFESNSKSLMHLNIFLKYDQITLNPIQSLVNLNSSLFSHAKSLQHLMLRSRQSYSPMMTNLSNLPNTLTNLIVNNVRIDIGESTDFWRICSLRNCVLSTCKINTTGNLNSLKNLLLHRSLNTLEVCLVVSEEIRPEMKKLVAKLATVQKQWGFRGRRGCRIIMGIDDVRPEIDDFYEQTRYQVYD